MTSRTSDAVHGIHSMIVSGELRRGDRLPPEGDLAERLRLSRSSLREAVRALSFIGVLRTRQGDGTYVTELDGATLLDNLGFVVDLASDRTLVEFFQLRRLLEPAATAMAAATIDDAGLAAVRACLATMEDAERAGDRDAFIDADLEFHHAVSAAVGNAVLTSVLRALGLRSVRTHRWRARVDGGALGRTLEDHRAILDALVRRDPEAARAAATSHLLGGEQWVRDLVSGRGTVDPADPAEEGRPA